MSEDASYELQQAIIRTLKADLAVMAMISGRVYGRVPRKEDEIIAEFPYLSFGPEDEVPAHIDCISGGDITMQIDIWSRQKSAREVKRLTKAVGAALDDADLALADNAIVCISVEGRRILSDPDGLTWHGVLTLQATVETH